jgi:alpha-tubulin suppressor-like RCC1 family protein
VLCWGHNNHGQLGDGMTTDRLTPAPVLLSPGGLPLTGVQSLALGGMHSCALLDSGEVRCWGLNEDGQLGNGTTTELPTPIPVPVLSSPGGPLLVGVRALALGRMHSCALVENGEARCWGSSEYGQLGDGTYNERPTPVPVLSSSGGLPLTGVEALALGRLHSCALVSGGEVRCWGYGSFGLLGDGSPIGAHRTVPVTVRLPEGQHLTGVQSLAAGDLHNCALMTSGELRCWGNNSAGQLGNGTTTNQPAAVGVRAWLGGPSLTGVQALALGRRSCALLSGGDLRCWGGNSDGQLGDGTMTNQLTPVAVLSSPGGPALMGVQALALGYDVSYGYGHSCALLGEGQVECWGNNRFGQLGDGTQTDRLFPEPVVFP